MVNFMLYTFYYSKKCEKKPSISTLCSFFCPLKPYCTGLPFYMTILQILADSCPGTSQIPFLHLCYFPLEPFQSLWALHPGQNVVGV